MDFSFSGLFERRGATLGLGPGDLLELQQTADESHRQSDVAHGEIERDRPKERLTKPDEDGCNSRSQVKDELCNQYGAVERSGRPKHEDAAAGAWWRYGGGGMVNRYHSFTNKFTFVNRILVRSIFVGMFFFFNLANYSTARISIKKIEENMSRKNFDFLNSQTEGAFENQNFDNMFQYEISNISFFQLRDNYNCIINRCLTFIFVKNGDNSYRHVTAMLGRYFYLPDSNMTDISNVLGNTVKFRFVDNMEDMGTHGIVAINKNWWPIIQFPRW